MARVLAAPATSRKAPRLALIGRPTTVAVPPRVKLPLASGVPAVGRTRTFCQVRVQIAPLLGAVTVKVSWVDVTDDIATAVPLETTLMFLEADDAPLILTVGAVPPVSKTNPAGAVRMIVP